VLKSATLFTATVVGSSTLFTLTKASLFIPSHGNLGSSCYVADFELLSVKLELRLSSSYPLTFLY
jgi:hypothetical protein